MDRRTFLAGTGALLAAPLAAEAQPGQTVPRIGAISVNTPGHAPHFSPGRGPGSEPPFWERMRELGWVEGQNLLVELRSAAGDTERLPGLAAELVRLKVTLIVMDNGHGARRAQETTRTLPICVVGGDLQGAGVVTNLAKPEANVTGVQLFQPDLAGKRLALLKEVVPRMARVGVLAPPAIAQVAKYLRAAEDAGRLLGLELRVIELFGPDQFSFDHAFSELTRVPVGGLLVMSFPTTVVHQEQIVALAAKGRVAAIYEFPDWLQVGGLMSYGPVRSEFWHQLAGCVDKILRGAKPGDVPVQQPIKFELVINLKTAKALGLTIPQSLLLRADQVIE